MGRHSRASYTATIQEKYFLNTTLVLATTLVFALIIFAALTALANVKANEVPDPIATGSEYGEDPYGTGAMPGGGQGVRYCPATGCAATSCHAETGEPPPGM